MDMNYILGREQVSLHNARVATSSPARIAHEGLAAAYGKILADSTFPHRFAPLVPFVLAPSLDDGQWEDDGGSSI